MDFRGSAEAKSVARLQALGVCVFLVAITWLVFGQTVRYDFVNYDDIDYVYANPNISHGLTIQGINYAFSGKHAGNWHPLTTLSHMLDCQLYGLHAGSHHFTNILLHTIAVVLLFLVLQQMTVGPRRTGTIWQSAFVAALFAIHPLRVESVAWISERKDVLSAVFFMLTLGAYVRYARSPSIGCYLMVPILFALGLMSKPMLVTVPLVLLLLDYWPLGRWPRAQSKEQSVGVSDQHGRRSPGAGRWSVVRGLVVEKLPLLALSVASGLATLWAQQSAVVAPVEKLPLISRTTNGLVACVIYLKQMIWPVRLAAFYPHPEDTLSVWEIGLAFMLIVLASAGAIVLRYKRPYVFTGWFWYLLMLLPVIGLIQAGPQAHADRYTYLPQIGLYLLLTWAITDALAAQLQRRILAVMGCITVIALALQAHVQASYWRNSESLWRHALAVTSRNFMAQRALLLAIPEDGSAPVQSEAEPMHVRGNPDAPVTLLEFGDYQCPPCGQIASFLEALVKEYDPRLRIVFRNFPLPTHKHAREAALAAEAAGLQGRYWEMHDALYREQAIWSKAGNARELFNDYAQDLGLNLDQFNKDIEGPQARTRVDADEARGKLLGVKNTPTIFVNNRQVVPIQPAGMRAIIDAALKEKS